ncbi:hypothetical protein [Luteolibacter luteus]|uniref:PepSY domain-containing protein n=1 Tax=Luteolibacter luteus TaxID=2728835 RepID=A0A858RDQ9_9BACT|nr:hypothetical protein [Luteolibacter luteus]QJE94761.1 hypothetical protein HHL09_02850 [Luteolibacter luteus]
MKAVRIAVLLLALVPGVQAKDWTLYSSGVNSIEDPKVFDWAYFKVSGEELAQTAYWSPEAGVAPPLSRNQAVEIAKQAAVAQGVHVSDPAKLKVVLQYPAEAKDMQERLGEKVSLWFYVVSFGKKPAEWFVVTLGGKLASRELTRR